MGGGHTRNGILAVVVATVALAGAQPVLAGAATPAPASGADSIYSGGEPLPASPSPPSMGGETKPEVEGGLGIAERCQKRRVRSGKRHGKKSRKRCKTSHR